MAEGQVLPLLLIVILERDILELKKMKKLVISLIILLFCSTIIEAEVRNKILYDNKVFDLCCNLLDPLYNRTGNIEWFDYSAVWEIEGDELYLLGIDNSKYAGLSDHKKTDMKELFGDKYISGKVKAEWFTGELRIPDGKVFQQFNNEFTYERDNIIYVDAGKITKKLVIDNTKKKVATEARSMLTPVISPDKSLFGIPYGTGEDEFIARFGRPMKIERSGKDGREITYGKKYIFVFEKTKLVGIKTISYEYEVYQVIPTHNTFDCLKWELSNGIKKDMNLAEVKKILGKEGSTIKDIIFSLPEQTLDVTQKVITLPIEAVKKVANAINPSEPEVRSETGDIRSKSQVVTPAKSTDNKEGEFTKENGPKFSFSTKKAHVEISLRREAERKNTDEAYIVSEISVRLK